MYYSQSTSRRTDGESVWNECVKLIVRDTSGMAGSKRKERSGEAL